ncbi:MAG TPA: prepilin-type N-terminal cleavage/methylation domain-containing protein [Dehalococcoidia bacterium]
MSEAHRSSIDHRRAGFTLTEVMIAAALSSFVLAGILSAFLMIGRTGFNSSSYSELEAEARRGLEIFAEDARNASDIHWNSNQSITLTVSTGTNATLLTTYAYDPQVSSPTYGTFYRLLGAADATGSRQILVHQVAPDFSFQRYKIEQPGIADNSATSDLETKQIQLTLRATRTGATTVEANHAVLSASYVLRNKRVSN